MEYGGKEGWPELTDLNRMHLVDKLNVYELSIRFMKKERTTLD